MKTIKFVLLLVAMAFISCSKEDTEQPLTGENGGQISRFQLVTVDFGSNTIPNDTYEGTFNKEPITLSKIDDSKLLFYVKEATPLGQTQLSIPSLNNTKIIYEVVEATLTQSPEATLQPLMEYQAQYGATLTNAPEDAPFLQNHNAFTQYFADLSDDDRIIAAKFYNTNKAIFDAVYTTNYDAIQGRMANQTQADFDFQLYRSLIAKHAFSVFVTAAAATAAAKVRPYGVHTVVLVTVAGAGIYKSIDFYDQIITDVFRVIGVKIDNILGLNNRMANAPNTTLTLTDNQATTLPFVVNGRNFTNTDSNVQKEYVQTFFTSKNKLNGFINDLNTAINWINNNIPLLTLSIITTVDVPATATLNSFDTNASLMQRFTFTVNHPNLSLENATLQSDGQLNLKVKFVGNPTATTINSTLNYTYNDDFSSFSGSFPIEVNLDTSTFLVGNWNLVEIFDPATSSNTILANQYITLASCPTVPTDNDTYAGFRYYGTASFSNNTFNCNVGKFQQHRYCISNNCFQSNQCYDNPNYYPHTGSYVSNGNYEFNVTENNGGSVNTIITKINQNTISVTQGEIIKKYSRQ
jgi:hypothetical protein